MARAFDDGSSQYLVYDGVAPATAYPFTMACWFNSDDLTINQALMRLGTTSDDESHGLAAAGSTGGDPVRATSWDGSSFGAAASSSGYSANTWHHAAGVWTTATSRAAFIDGGSKGTNFTNTTPTGLDNISIGAAVYTSIDSYASGSIAEAAVWNVALTDAEIAALASGASPLAVRPASLVFYAPLWRDEDTDYVGGLSLTANGAPTISTHAPGIYGRARPHVGLGIGAVSGLSVSVSDSPSVADTPTVLLIEPDLNVALDSTDVTKWQQGVKIITP